MTYHDPNWEVITSTQILVTVLANALEAMERSMIEADKPNKQRIG